MLSVEPIFKNKNPPGVESRQIPSFWRLFKHLTKPNNPLRTSLVIPSTEEWNPSLRLTIFDNSDIIPHDSVLTFVVPHSEVHKRIDFVW